LSEIRNQAKVLTSGKNTKSDKSQPVARLRYPAAIDLAPNTIPYNQ
jgi:hypothetical protein